MLKPSNDLRQKVLDVYKESGHKSKTCSIFNISRMTLNRWIQFEHVQGHVNRPHPEKVSHPYKIKNLPVFKQFVENAIILKPKN